MREIPFHRPCIEDDDIAEVAQTLRNGWLTMGPRTIEFEEAFRKEIGCAYAVSLNSCTAALHIALKVIGLKKDDEVILPTVTFAATAEVVRYFDAHPVIVDVDPGTHNITPFEIERHITRKTRAIIPVHFAGQPAPMDEIKALADAYNLRVIEDAAHCFPSRYKGKPVGTLGDITAFSFYATKTLATGEGGMATTDHADYAERMQILRLHGISKDAWKRYSALGNWYYEIIDIGYKYNLTDVQAALGLAQLRKAHRMWQQRCHIAARYTERFKDSRYIIPPTIKDYAETSWHLYVIKLRCERLTISRDQFIDELNKRGVGVSVHFIPLHRHPVYRNTYHLRPHEFPNAEWIYERCISLPIYPDMTEEDIDYVCDQVLEVAQRYEKAVIPASRISLAAPDIADSGRTAVMEVLKTNSLSFGSRLTEFEQAAAQFAGTKYGVAVNSGTSALHLIVRALGIRDGDRVITTPFSFIASANCILFERAVPVFADIDSRDLNFRPDLVEDLLKKDKKKTIKAILAVDIFGHPVAWDELYNIAQKYNVAIIEDSSEALGSAYRSPETLPKRRWTFYKRAGSFGVAGVFAFYPNKQITTGEGGMILTDSRRIYELCRSMRNQGRTDKGEWLGHVRLGYNYRISDINCALGLAQFQRIEEILQKRASVAQKYTDRLKGCHDLTVPYQAPHIQLGWFVYVVRLHQTFTRVQRDAIVQKLKEKGIEASNYFPPIHLQPFYRTAFGYRRGDFPVTEQVADRTIALPFHNNLQDAEIDYVVENLQQAILAVRGKRR